MKNKNTMPKIGLNVTVLILTLGLLTGIYSCKRLVDIEPPATSITSGNVFGSDATAVAVLTGILARVSNTNTLSFDVNTTSFWEGLSADELILWSGADNTNNAKQIAYFHNNLNVNAGSEYWNPIYRNIFSCNSVIEGLDQNGKALTPAVKQQLLGEAKFMRAYFYFYLLNLFGDLPLALSSDYKVNSGLVRSNKELIYQQIINDLKEAQNILSDQYLKGDALTPYPEGAQERVRPTKWAATAMLARTYLYTKNWAQAEFQATSIINHSMLYFLTPLDKVFLKNSFEAIWQLQPVDAFITNTQDANLFILPSTGPNRDNLVSLNKNLINAFEFNDQRRINWINSVNVSGEAFYFPFKYKINIPNSEVLEYQMMLRLGEQYLIRAEVRAQQNNLTEAIEDLDAIRNRAGLPLIREIEPEITKENLLKAILHERQVELFTESGHRWFDLKRTGNIDAVMNVVTTEKGGSWNSNWQLYPIPLGDIQKNSNLVQNPGY
jgi:hypothetical protein